MKICLFGTYYYSYSRNAVLRTGLRRIGVKVVEAHRIASKRSLESASDITFFNMCRLVIERVDTAVTLLKEYKKVKNSDVVVVLYPSYIIFPIAWALCFIFRKKLIFDSFTSVYDTLVNDRTLMQKTSLKARLIKLYEKTILRLSDKVFVDTPLMGKYIKSEFAVSQEKLFVVPVGSDDTIYKRSRKVSSGKITKIIWFGGYSPLQAAEYVVKAAKNLSKNKFINFTLVGDGVLKKEVTSYVQKHSLRNVVFLNELTQKELARKIRESDIMLGIFANNSMSRRVVPNKVYAGISSGKVVVTASLPPVRKIFTQNKNIVFVRPEDHLDLAKKILNLSKNEKLMRKIAENGYELYKKDFTPEKVAKVFLSNITA